jgi:CspA family cold shock protein
MTGPVETAEPAETFCCDAFRPIKLPAIPDLGLSSLTRAAGAQSILRSPAKDTPPRVLRRVLMRQTGTVKFFNQSKGFGFITPDEGGKDVFVHITAVERSGIGPLDEGMKVSFETEPDKRGKGPKAVNLQLAGG